MFWGPIIIIKNFNSINSKKPWPSIFDFTSFARIWFCFTNHDALALCYGWLPSRLPSHCTCGSNFSIEHVLSCLKSGFPSIRHNEVRDLTATLLTNVCHDVKVEPDLQPLNNEAFHHKTANIQDGT